MKAVRLMGLATALVVATPSPAYAHVVGPGGGFDVEALLIGLALVFFAYRLRAEGVRKASFLATGGLGIAIVVASFAIPQLSRPSSNGISLKIVRPGRGATVPAGRPVRIGITLTNARVADSPRDTSAGHIHVYVDGRLVRMPYGTNVKVSLHSGRHRITVEYVNPKHIAYSPPVRAGVDVTAK
jgi:hypothetical protein